MKEEAPAKINLFLHVTGKRSDNYHLLESIFVFCDLCDEITVTESNNLSLEIDGEFAPTLIKAGNNDIKNNLVIKAANLLNKAANSNYTANIKLLKNIPIASGIGGGSADAAATLKLLNKFWQLNLPDDTLHNIALQLGADVPSCLLSKSCYVTDIGETIEALDTIPSLNMVLVNPLKPISTPEIFKMGFTKFEDIIGKDQILSGDLIGFLQTTCNQLQNNAILILPEIRQILGILEQQLGCLIARMSGSGATCFAIFENQDLANKAANNIKKQFSHWWVKKTAS